MFSPKAIGKGWPAHARAPDNNVAMTMTTSAIGLNISVPDSLVAFLRIIARVMIGSFDTAQATLPLTLSLCQTDPATSVCINPAQPTQDSLLVEIVAGDSPTFAVFVNATGPVALDPASSRIFLRFTDQLGEVRGATSVAVQNEP